MEAVESLMLVRVKVPKDKYGWYGGKRCRNGEEMRLFKPQDFSKNWMEIVDATPEQRAVALGEPLAVVVDNNISQAKKDEMIKRLREGK